MALIARIAEELAKKGYRVSEEVTSANPRLIDRLVDRAKVGDLDFKTLNRVESASVREVSELLLNSVRKADGTLSRSAVLDLHQAYTQAAIKEFGRGPAAEAALEGFRETMSATWADLRRTKTLTATEARSDALTAAATNRAAAAQVIQPPRAVTPVPSAAPAPRPAGGPVAPVARPVAVGPQQTPPPAATGTDVRVASATRHDAGGGEVLPPADGFTPTPRRTQPVEVVDVDGSPVRREPVPLADEVPVDDAARTPRDLPPLEMDPVDRWRYETGGQRRPANPPADPPAAAPAPAPQPDPHHGHGGHATSEELAAKERALQEDKFKFRDNMYSARSAITKGLRGFDEGGYAQKKAAFDQIVDNIEGSGYIARPDSVDAVRAAGRVPDPAAAQAGQTAVRDIEEIKRVLTTRPGQQADGSFIGGIITVDEWTALRKSMHGEVLAAQQSEIANTLDVLRASKTRNLIDPKGLKDAFAALRVASADPEFLAHATRKAGGDLELHEGAVRTPRAIHRDLMDGKPVDRRELNRLEAYFERYYTQQPTTTSDPGFLSNALSAVTGGKLGGKGKVISDEPSLLDREAEWATGHPVVRHANTGLRATASATALVVGTAAAGAGIYAAYQGQSVFFDPDQADSTGKRWGIAALTLGPGDWLKSDTGTIKNLYSQAIYQEMQRDPTRIAHWQQKAGESRDLSPAVAEAVAAVNESQTTLTTAVGARAQAQRETDQREIESGAVSAARQVAAHAAGTYQAPPPAEKGIKSEDVSDALSKVYEGQGISATQMDELAAAFAKKGTIVTKEEYEAVKADNKQIPQTGYQALEKILGPQFPKP